MGKDGGALQNVRVIGFTYDGDATDVDMLANLSSKAYGIDSEGNPTTGNPVIEGTLNVAGSIYEDAGEVVKSKYPNLTLNVLGGYFMRFEDAEVLRVLLANGVGDGVGITKAAAAEVTSIGRWFNKNTSIKKFDEFRFFTGVTSLEGGSSSVGGAFWQSAIESIILPDSMRTIGVRAFDGCSNLRISELPAGLSNVGESAFSGIISAPRDIILPSLTSLGNSAFTGVSGIQRILDLGRITIIQGGGSLATNSSPFRSCPDVEVFIVPSTVSSLGKGAISFLPSLTTLILKPSTPPTYGDNSIYSLPAAAKFYVPSASVSTYREAVGWVGYASRISPISQLEQDNNGLFKEIYEYIKDML